jgi:hypothetical protein
MMNVEQARRVFARSVIAAGFVCLCMAPPLVAADEDDDVATARWQAAIAQVAAPTEGCYTANFPSYEWKEVACIVAPDRLFLPTRGGPHAETVGDGHDYAAGVTGLMSSATGSFPVVKGVTSEIDNGANDYSIQLNSNFMNTAVCNGHSGCLSWLQYVYSSGERAAFMQTWLIHWNATCPGGWMSAGGGDCYRNSAAVGVPQEPIKKLKKLVMNGTAAANGNDVLTFSVGKKAYKTQGADSVVDLATGWTGSEFNIIGDGGGGQARFNTGSSMTVMIQVNNGTSNTPTCQSDAGTTGETNNLNLGACTAHGGSAPYIQFTQSN